MRLLEERFRYSENQSSRSVTSFVGLGHGDMEWGLRTMFLFSTTRDDKLVFDMNEKANRP